MNIAKPVVQQLKAVHFSCYTADEIRKGSALTITNSNTLDINGHPSKGGLFDSALGPHSKDFNCTTCSLGYFDCQGHYGHIELPLPVYSPTTFPLMYSLLKGTCFFCFRFRISTSLKYIFMAKMLLFNHGLLKESMELEDHVSVDKINLGKDGMEDEDLPQELEELFPSKRSQAEEIELLMQRVTDYVQEALKKSPTPIPLSEQKDFMMTKYRDQLVNDFMRKLSTYSDCQACRAPAMKLRRDGYSKIFLCPPALKDTKKAPRPFVFSEATILAHRASLREKKKKQTKKIKDSTSQPPLDSAAVSDEGLESWDLSSPLASNYEINHDRELQYVMQGGPNAGALGIGKEVSKSGQYLNPLVIQALLELIWHQEKVLLDLMLVSQSRPNAVHIHPASPSSQYYQPLSSHQLCFLEVLAVPPNKFRPPAVVNGAMFDNFRNSVLKEVIINANIIREKTQLLLDPALTSPDVPARAYRDALYARNAAWLLMQNFVNSFIDNTKTTTSHYSNGTVPPGVRQLLEKKEGLFRKNMMGKRVNYAARSVISPDPWIEPNEIGVPYVFAKKLTYPEPVTGHNVNDLRQCVLNGPDVWPGATDIQLEDGRLQSLYGCTQEQRAALASQLLTPTQNYRKDVPAYLQQTNKKVFRHLRNDDIVLLNRQPTLHKPSIMAHRVRVLPAERTLRLHYANCNTYNADFDGDEMNIHLAQNQVARAEAFHIANSDHQYLVPTDGSPLRGLIQDHVVTGVLLTKRDSFFEKHDYHDLLMGALPQETMCQGRIRTVPPAILKPRPLWTGKQIITTLLLNLLNGLPALNLLSKAKVGGNYWGPHGEEEGEVRFCHGELVTGVLDKSQIGASAYGFVHSVYELYGGDKAGRLLGALSRLFSKHLLHMGFSVRLDDLLLTKDGDQCRRTLLEGGRHMGAKAAMEYTQVQSKKHLKGALELVLRDKELHAGLDAHMKSKTNQLTSSVIAKCLPDGLFKKFPENGMQLMTVAGAKGSNVNVSQISCCLGQQELEGRRVPVMPSGKTLPSFQAYDPSARAGGFIAGRFLTGLNPQEYFFHCMAGREGLIDTAVKTARSGYLQRCLIKHLEGLRIHYDGSVRDSDGTLIQFLYGEDGLDVTKQKHLEQFRFCSENHAALNQRYKPADLENHIDERKASSLRKQLRKQLSKGEESADALEKGVSTLYDTVQTQLSPYAYLGSVSERFYEKLSEYKEANPDSLLYRKKKKSSSSRLHQPCLSQDGFEGLMYLKYLRSLVEPGEGVGILASQSIGEPSTQMTLNTFHFAGFGAKNVTLGIPRLREIIMTASTAIKTPAMALTMKPHVSERFRDRFCRELSQLKLSAITKGVEVRERLTSTESIAMREYRIRIDLFSKDDYQAFYHIDAKWVKNVIKHRLLKQLDLIIKKEHRLVKLGETMSTEDVITKHHLSKLNKLKQKNGDEGDEQGGSGGRAGDDDDMDIDASAKRKKGSDKKDRDAVDDDDDDDEGEGGSEGEGDDEEAGVTSSKYAKKKKQLATYEDDVGGDEDEFGQKSKSDATGKGGLAMDLDAPSDEDETNFDSLPNLNAAFPLEKETCNRTTTGAQQGIQKEVGDDEENDDNDEEQVLGTHSYVTSFEYLPKEGVCKIELRIPAKRKHLLMVPLLEKAIRATVIREVAGITRCFPEASFSSNSEGLEVAADGVNLLGMWDYAEILDVHSLYTNDIYAMYKVYGVEAARASIIKEIAGVFSGYGISVDVRHLTLIADYMTFEGGYKPFNRYGINSNPSPFLKMSFETSCQFLKTATVIGDMDTLKSASARLVVGQVIESGSGCFEIVQPLCSV